MQLLQTLDLPTAAGLLYDWRFWGRPDQLPPPGAGTDWSVWLILTGRGWGKTRTGAETLRDQVAAHRVTRVALVGRTSADVRDVMVEGPDGILAVSPPWFRPDYEPSKRRLTWPNGTVGSTFEAIEPEQLRGPQQEFFWADELASWRYSAAWDNLLLGTRVGRAPWGVATTTPKPRPLIKQLLRDPDVRVTKGTTWDNLQNLAPTFMRRVVRRYIGTRIGRQELGGELLEDNPNALWQRATIERNRVIAFPEFDEIAVAVDPQAAVTEGSAETGIVAGGRRGGPGEGHGYLIEDATLSGPPHVWATAAIALYRKVGASVIIAETNNGGDMVVETIKAVDATVPVVKVTASRGKAVRAQPISTLYEQNRIHHVGFFPQLEDQLCEWDPSGETDEELSPEEREAKRLDRMDANVWLWTYLLLGERAEYRIY